MFLHGLCQPAHLAANRCCVTQAGSFGSLNPETTREKVYVAEFIESRSGDFLTIRCSCKVFSSMS